jgi:hypothetical protein
MISPPAHHGTPIVTPCWDSGEQLHGSYVRFLNNTSKPGPSFTFIIIFLCHQVEIPFLCSFWISIVILGWKVGEEIKHPEKERECHMERIAWNQHANKGLQRKLKVEKTCSLLVTLKGMSVLSVQKSTGTWRLSAECDTVFCHSARQTTTTQKLHREWRLTDGNKKILWNNFCKTKPH